MIDNVDTCVYNGNYDRRNLNVESLKSYVLYLVERALYIHTYLTKLLGGACYENSVFKRHARKFFDTLSKFCIFGVLNNRNEYNAQTTSTSKRVYPFFGP